MNTIFSALSLPLLALGLTKPVNAAVVTADHDYRQGDTLLEGYVAYEPAKERRPGIVVVHEWSGINQYVKMRAAQLAGMGYVVLAADIYGKGIKPANTDEAARQAGIYRADRKLMRARAAAALAELKKLPGVDPSRTAVMGYCFGGGVALELARSGADVLGAASFHGNLDTPTPQDAKNIRGRVIAFHGADDPLVSSAAVSAFQEEMRAGGVDWELNIYGKAVHGFSNPSNGDDPKKGLAYNAEADRRSWKALQDFLNEIFAR